MAMRAGATKSVLLTLARDKKVPHSHPNPHLSQPRLAFGCRRVPLANQQPGCYLGSQPCGCRDTDWLISIVNNELLVNTNDIVT